MAEVSSAHELFNIIYMTMKRMITMIVLHCSATRCNRTYSVQQLYHDHVEVNVGATSATMSISCAVARWNLPVPYISPVPMPRVSMPTASGSVTREAWMRMAILPTLARRSRRWRWRDSSCSCTSSFLPSTGCSAIVTCRAYTRLVPASMPRSCKAY